MRGRDDTVEEPVNAMAPGAAGTLRSVRSQRSRFLAGLFFCTLASLALELLDTRLLSAMTWYHLSFYAISTAMLGMSAGALHVFVAGRRFEGERAPRALARFGLGFAVSIPVTHVVNTWMPLSPDGGLAASLGTMAYIAVLTIPFYFSGVLVTISLTRIPGPTGLVYGVDLVGAALGSLLVLPLLTLTNISSAVLFIGALAAIAAWCWQPPEDRMRRRGALFLAGLLAVVAGINTVTVGGIRVRWAKGAPVETEDIAHEAWNLNSHVVVYEPAWTPPFYWGPSPRVPPEQLETVFMTIDGDASTTMTRWDGRDLDALSWVQHDVTSAPYQVGKGGDVAIVGVGGGRDVLTALWGGSTSVTGVEVNGAFIRMLEGPFRDFASLADHPDVTLVHDEARSYFTRCEQRFDLLQMSLVDTWAATGAGALTLSENGLYTVEAWEVFLGALQHDGWFVVSRWYDPANVSETSRLMALAVASLHRRGVERPGDHIVLVATGRIATLVLAVSPFTAREIERFEAVAAKHGYDIVASPSHHPADPLLAEILAASDARSLDAAVQDPVFDYSPPTDRRPYFFNNLKPGLGMPTQETLGEGPIAGNLVAQSVLLRLLAITALLVAAIIVGPLVRLGLPSMGRLPFVLAVAYFSLIGMGFMLVQIPLMQRFSVYLGHPSLTVPIVLFSMILATGAGSFLSDRLSVDRGPALLIGIPLVCAGAIAALAGLIQPLIDHTLQQGLFVRGGLVVAVTAPVAALLGFCFPIGLRLVQRLSTEATAWMWGVNGACGVLASVFAVVISMWWGIDTSLFAGACAYALLALPAYGLRRSAR